MALRRLGISSLLLVLVLAAFTLACGGRGPLLDYERDPAEETDAGASDGGAPDAGSDGGAPDDAGFVCPSALEECELGACVDTRVDPEHCGGCGLRCDGDMVCALGVCAQECPASRTDCAGGCVDLAFDDANCGACGQACGAGTACRSGACVNGSELGDTDGDTIADLDEELASARETEGDGVPDGLDEDSDGDGFPDAWEAGDDDPLTLPVDTDGDWTPDAYDLDSDGDGLVDAAELTRACLDRTNPDSDGDGQSDFAEVTAGSDPCDPESIIPEFYFELPLDDPSGESAGTLTFDTNIRRADLHVHVDTTGSMNEEINQLQLSLRDTIIPGVAALIPDAAFGVSEFEDFPYGSLGQARCNGGRSPDRPFGLLQQVTTDAALADQGVQDLDHPLGCGGDLPEAGFESLYQIATGEGVTWPSGSVSAFVSDASVPGAGTLGGVGFRAGALPIVVHITDATSHTQDEYVSAGVSGAHSLAATETALQALGAKLVGVTSSLAARTQLIGLALATDSYVAPVAGSCSTGSGGAAEAPTSHEGELVCPLVFTTDTNGSGLSATLIDAVDEIVTSIRLDTVSVRVIDDPHGFVRATIPRSATPPAGAAAPTVVDLDGDSIYDAFAQLTPGTVVSFSILTYNDAVAPTDSDQVFALTLQVVGNGVTVLDEKTVVIVVPRASS